MRRRLPSAGCIAFRLLERNKLDSKQHETEDECQSFHFQYPRLNPVMITAAQHSQNIVQQNAAAQFIVQCCVEPLPVYRNA